MSFVLDHIAIQTDDYDNTVSWYKEFFSCREAWDRTWEQLPAGIQKRMPLCTRLVELKVDEVRFHVFDIKEGYALPSERALQYQHFGIVVDTVERLHDLREKWIQLYDSGRFRFKTTDQPTDFIPSPGDMQCFYARDPNGLEFEVIHFA